MNWKRTIYGLPMMRAYRQYRASQLAARHVPTRHGFTFAGNPAYRSDGWEIHERRLVERLLPAVDVFVDVGANQGFYTCLAASRGVATVSVEPEPSNLRYLLGNVRANAFSEVEVFPVAVSDAVGVLEFYGDSDTGSLVRGWHEVADWFRETVAVNTLDNLFADRWPERRLFVKIDVEGVEHQVLEGARRLVERTKRPFWLVEAFPTGRDRDRSRNPHFEGIFERMFGAGYECRLATAPERTVSIDDARRWAREPERDDGYNFLFAEPGAADVLQGPAT